MRIVPLCLISLIMQHKPQHSMEMERTLYASPLLGSQQPTRNHEQSFVTVWFSVSQWRAPKTTSAPGQLAGNVGSKCHNTWHGSVWVVSLYPDRLGLWWLRAPYSFRFRYCWTHGTDLLRGCLKTPYVMQDLSSSTKQNQFPSQESL